MVVHVITGAATTVPVNTTGALVCLFKAAAGGISPLRALSVACTWKEPEPTVVGVPKIVVVGPVVGVKLKPAGNALVVQV